MKAWQHEGDSTINILDPCRLLVTRMIAGLEISFKKWPQQSEILMSFYSFSEDNSTSDFQC